MIEEGRRQRQTCGNRRRIRRHNRGNQTRLILPLEGPFAREHLVQHCTKCEDVGPGIGLFAFELLRRHVRHRADDRPFPRQIRRQRPDAGFFVHSRSKFDPACQTEIKQLGSVLSEHDVRRLEVPMNNTVPVRRDREHRQSGSHIEGLLPTATVPASAVVQESVRRDTP